VAEVGGPDAGAGWRETGQAVRNWGRWGPGDQRGTMNLVGAEQIRRAAAAVSAGKLFDLSIPLDSRGPQDGSDRGNPVRLMSVIGGAGDGGGAFRYNDDYVFMPLQAGTQWDALCHVYYDGLMFNGVPASAVDAVGASRLGIETQSPGVTGRAVLADVAGHEGVRWLPGGMAIGPQLLEDTLRDQGTDLADGDILLVRTGWLRMLAEQRDRAAFFATEPGLSWQCCAWLHEHQVAAVASDNWALEVLPSAIPGESYPAHMILIRDMGMMIGEMFALDALAANCAADGVYESLLCAPVLKFTGGAGTPVNPIAIK
jgi:kynurenine formamidase